MSSTGAVSPPRSEHPSPRATVLWVAALAILSAALRAVVWRHPVPVHGDELEFIAALGFPSPHPVHHPGYPLWIALGTALNYFGLAPYAAFQVWAAIASILTPIIFYLGVRRLVSDTLAGWSAIALSANPLFSFCSVTALNYSLACCVSLVVVGWCWVAISGGAGRCALKAAVLLSIASFLRADLLIGLGPLVVYSAWKARSLRPASLTLSIGLALLFATTWLLYLAGSGDAAPPSLRHTIDVVFGTSVFRLGLVNGVARNALKLAANLAWDSGAATPVLLVLAFRVRSIARARPGLLRLLVVWVLPFGAVLVLIHMSEATHVLLLIPAGYAFLAIGLDALIPPRKAALIMCALAFCSAVQFAAYPWSAESTGWKRLVDAKIGFISAAGLRHIDERQRIHRPGDFWPTGAHGGR